ncbi:MAG: RluA family pseudouridine synthase [Puniceicoccales bacterium]|jgi:23S rRNA pseudouridine1911/1915/1917 synthase|nr:RluA family pseudouridine synthase [Puniceicoccales bacterium]
MLEVFTVPAEVSPDRADKVLAICLGALSRSQVQRLLDDGRIVLQGSPVRVLGRRCRLAPGDAVLINRPPPPPTQLVPAVIPLDVLWEDEHLLAVNKASGLTTHPGAGTGENTLAHAALHHTKGRLAAAGGTTRPGIVHRLDKGTSGVILLAKTDLAYHALVRQFSERKPDKQYLALVRRRPALLSGSIREPVARHPSNRVKMAVREDGKPARTDWAVEECFGEQAARVRCWLLTGRTHQIRVHLAHAGHALLGDATYGKAEHGEAWPVARVMLHAERINLAHPVSGKALEIVAPVPTDFLAVEAHLRERFGSRRIEPIPPGTRRA